MNREYKRYNAKKKIVFARGSIISLLSTAMCLGLLLGSALIGSAQGAEVRPVLAAGGEIAVNTRTTVKYTRLEGADGAISSAAAGDTIELLQDVVLAAGVEISGKNITLDGKGCTIQRQVDNPAPLFSVQGGGSLSLLGVTLDGGMGKHTLGVGPLVRLSAGSLILDTGAVLQNNEVDFEGGGVFLDGSSGSVNHLTMKGNAMIKNCAARTSGGGVFASLGNTTTASVIRIENDAQITANSAASGGGIFIRATVNGGLGALTLGDNGAITGNLATGAGGGVYVSNFQGAAATPLSLEIGGNAAISGNTAAKGGGVYFYSSHPKDSLSVAGTARIENNTAADGGGVFVNGMGGSPLFTLNGGIIAGNAASGLGGGICFQSAATAIPDVPAYNASEGVAVTTAKTGGLTILEGAIKNNTAGTGGGVYYSAPGGSFTLSGGSLTGNTAAVSGGGLYLAGAEGSNMSAVISTGKAVTGNKTTDTGNRQNQELGGGGVFFTYTDLALKDGAKITGNETERNGGGLYGTQDCTLTMEQSSEVSGNTAQGSGGGVYLNFSSTLTMLEGSAVSGNTAGAGGGIYLNNLTGGTMKGLVINNKAAGNGGGIYYHTGSIMGDEPVLRIQTGAVISGNSAKLEGGDSSGFGGGIYQTGAPAPMENDNDIAFGTLSLEGGSISGNTAGVGGGVFVARSRFEMSGGVMEDNHSATNKGHALWVDRQTVALTKAQGGIATIKVDQSHFIHTGANRDTVVIGAGTLGDIVFDKDFVMDTNLLLESSPEAKTRSALSVTDGTTLILTGRLTVGVQEGTGSIYTLNLDPGGGNILFRSSGQSLGSDLMNQKVDAMYRVPGDSYTLYHQWPDGLPYRADQAFAGWLDSEKLLPVGLDSLTGDRALTAQWGPLDILCYDGDTQITGLFPSQFTYGRGKTDMSEVIPEKAGYTFAGWYDNPGLTGAQVTSFSNDQPTAKVFYAKWTPVVLSDADPMPILEYNTENQRDPILKANPYPEAVPMPEWTPAPNPAPIPEPTPTPDPEPDPYTDPAPEPEPGPEPVPAPAIPSNEFPGFYAQLKRDVLDQIKMGGGLIMNMGNLEIPLSGVAQPYVWSPLNLLLAILGGVLSLFLLAELVLERKPASVSAQSDMARSPSSHDRKKQCLWRLAGILTGLSSAATFFLTQNMRYLMVVIDRWTLLMVIYMMVQVLVFVSLRRSDDEKMGEWI